MTTTGHPRHSALAAIDVLIVEDDDVDRERTRRMIAKHAPAMKLTEAATGRAMIDAMATRDFDVVLLDFHLDDCTAADLLPTVLAMGGPRCPVIILTGHGDENLAVWALQHGAAGYLGKAKLTAPRLLDTIEEAVVRGRRDEGAPIGIDADSLELPSDRPRPTRRTWAAVSRPRDRRGRRTDWTSSRATRARST